MDTPGSSLDRPGDDSLASLGTGVADALRRFAAAPERAPGSRVGGHYTLERRLGRGGMGVVYRAHDEELDRQVAIKFHGTPTDPRAAEALLREARAMARLAHPNVVTVHEVGSDGGQVFIAMEWVDGVDLRRWLVDRPRRWQEVLERFLAAGEGLAAAHRVGLVHRDFKPSNVLLGADGRVRVADFGLACAPTDPTSPAGTPGYMAPEQSTGAAVDARADQYSFCVALFEALHGRLPDAATPAPRGVPPSVLAALRRGLLADPALRHRDLSALLAALRVGAAPRRRALALTAGALFVGIGVVIGAAAPGGGVVCEDAAWAAEDVLPRARRDALASRFAGLGGEYSAQAWARVEASLDRYIAGLTGAAVEACRDTHARGVQSDDLLDLRMACLTRARRELDARVAELERIEESTIAASISLATALPEIAACADPELLRADPRRIAAADAGRLHALETELAAARGRLIAGASAEAHARAEALGDEIAALSVPALRAEQRQILGDARLVEHATDEARRWYEDGYLGARAAGDDVHAGRLSTAMAGLLARYAGEHRTSLFWVRLARAELGRSGGDRTREVDLLLIEGSALAGLGDQEEALRSYAEAEALVRRRGSTRPEHMAVVLSHRGIALELLGRYEAALAAQEEALAIVRETLGESHPKVVDQLNLTGTALAAAGRTAEAQARYEAAIDLAERLFPRDGPVLAIPLANLAVLHGDEGRYPRAVALLERVLSIQEAGSHNPVHLATTLSMLGTYRSNAGDPRAGLVLLDRALALEIQTFAADHPRIAECRMRRAEVLAAAGDRETALREQLVAAAGLEAALGPDHPTLADSLTSLGELLHASGRLAEAEQTLVRARDIWRRIDPTHPQAARPTRALAAVQRARGAPPPAAASGSSDAPPASRGEP